MTPKKMEGDEAQRRRKARAARRSGKSASEAGATTGASKQRDEMPRSEGFLTKLRNIRRGKQRVIRQATPEPNPGSGSPTGRPVRKKKAPRSARPSARKHRRG